MSDEFLCPAHGPGVISGPCSGNVLVNGKPAARMLDPASCVSGLQNSITTGSPTVLVNSRLFARALDRDEHGGQLIAGSPNVLVGGPAVCFVGPPARRTKNACMHAHET